MTTTHLIGHASARAAAHKARRGDAPTGRASRLTAIVYLVVALATPLIVYFGPDVQAPTANIVANAALDGHFVLQRQKPAREPRANAARAAASR